MTAYVPQLTLPYSAFSHPAVSILLPVTLGAGIGYSTRPSETQKTYAELKQPPLRPPPWLFGPVWTTIYGLMGYAAHRAVHLGTSPLNLTPDGLDTIRLAKSGATIYSVQLALNLAWMPLFFGLKKPILATVDIVALLGLNGWLTYTWFKVDRVAGWCLVPYVAWLGFATYLSAGVGYLNGWDLDTKGKKRE